MIDRPDELSTKTLQVAHQDLAADFDELLFLAMGLNSRIREFLHEMSVHKKDVLPETRETLKQISESILKQVEKQTRLISEVTLNLSPVTSLRGVTDEAISKIFKRSLRRPNGFTLATSHVLAMTHLVTHGIEKKKSIADAIRSLYGIVGSLTTATEWQSPSFAHSLHSQAGIQTGKIVATFNDYKRDQHENAKAYEEAFLKEYIDAPFKLPIHIFATSSGMAAVTTILAFLVGEDKCKNHVLLGKSSYFENKLLVHNFFKNRVSEFDEMDTEELIQTVQKTPPPIIFLDTLCNTETVAVPDLTTIIKRLSASIKADTYLVIDNSCMGPSVQPLKSLLVRSPKLHIICIESLNKYYQFGMDRVTGGIVWAVGKDIGKLFDYRVHTGTNMPDASVFSLPKPNRTMLNTRLGRLERNTVVLATSLSEFVKTAPQCPIISINYPGLPTHPAYRWTGPMKYHGSFFALSFQPKYRTVKYYKRFVAAVIQEAKKQGVDIVSGTSFGFNTTRIYLTAVHATTTKPFIRIAVGTETLMEIEKIAKVLENVIECL